VSNPLLHLLIWVSQAVLWRVRPVPFASPVAVHANSVPASLGKT
jgi:hypothetical protein